MRVFRQWTTVRLVFLLLLVAGAAIGAQPAAAPVEPDGGPLGLADALALAMAHNPRLAVFDLERRVRDALELQASLRPNPELGLEVENFAGSGDFRGFNSPEYTLSLGQMFELGGKRGKRSEVAALQSDLAAWDYEAARIEVFGEVSRAFIATVTAQKQIELADELISVGWQDLAAVARRVEAGAASPIEATRAKVNLATAELDRENALLSLTAARARLAATWASDHPVFDQAQGDLDEVALPPDLEVLKTRLETSPNIARWETETAQSRAALELERALGKIDLMAEGGYRYMAGTDDGAFVMGLSIPLRLNNPNKGRARAAEYQVTQAGKNRQAALVTANASLATAFAELSSAHKTAIALKDVIMPEALKAMATAEDAYYKGLFSFTDVLAVQLTYFKLQGRYIASLARYHLAATDIEQLVAGPLFANMQEQE